MEAPQAWWGAAPRWEVTSGKMTIPPAARLGKERPTARTDANSSSRRKSDFEATGNQGPDHLSESKEQPFLRRPGP